MAIFPPGTPTLGGQAGGSSVPVVTTVATESDIPPSAQGFYFVTASEKGDSQLYLYNGGIRYWLAMVKDS
ncbi:hypothetical protein V4833_21765 [Enterobacter sp. HK169]|uniref:hypothetical protein n=1 Tax=Enterobacter sp. HK169 TaxID=1868135 RepID=UPI002F40AA28